MIRIFHPNHGYLLVTDEQEKKRLLESGGYVSETLGDDKPTVSTVEQIEDKTVIAKPRGRPKKWP